MKRGRLCPSAPLWVLVAVTWLSYPPRGLQSRIGTDKARPFVPLPSPQPPPPTAVSPTRSTLPSGIYFKVLACLFILFRDFSVLCGEENSNGVIMKYYFTSLFIHNKQREMIGD